MTDIQPPAWRPVVYLRGRGQPQNVWDRVELAMWARGWRTVKDRATAFHLARGGCPVVLADFTAEHVGLAVDWITVGRVRAHYNKTIVNATVGDLLVTEDHARRIREGADWLDESAQQVTMEMELPLVTGGRVNRPRRRAERFTDRTLDEHLLADMVGKHFTM